MNKKAVVLLSGGLDSTTLLALALDQAYECYTLTFDYKQRLCLEPTVARYISQHLSAKAHKTFSLSLDQFGASALTDHTIPVPDYSDNSAIPTTYVPARNTIFLSIALAWAETLEAEHIFFGPNKLDHDHYPDCRPAYLDAFQTMANLATKQGAQGNKVTIHTPLITLDKAEIILLGQKLGVDYGLTVTCYNMGNDRIACGRCEACVLRREGFKAAKVEDPTKY